jgi:hypothetical protein
LVVVLSINRVNKLQEGSDLPVETSSTLLFLGYIATWGRNWMWEDIDNNQTIKVDTLWIAERLKAGILIWTKDRSYDRKQVADLSGVGWIIVFKKTGLC